MAGRNDFHPFAVGPDAIVLTNQQWAEEIPRLPGHRPGMASAAMANKAERQGTAMAAAWGLLVSEYGRDALDDGDIRKLADALQYLISQICGHETATGSSSLTNVMLTITEQNIADGYFDLPENVSAAKADRTAVFLNADACYYGRDYEVVWDDYGDLRRVSFSGLGLEGIPIQAGDLTWVFYHAADDEGGTGDPGDNDDGDDGETPSVSDGNLYGGTPEMYLADYPNGNIWGGGPGMLEDEYLDGELYGGSPTTI